MLTVEIGVLEGSEVVYLAGPMRDCEDFNYPSFDALAKRLRTAGFFVLNPADTNGQDGNGPRDRFIRADLGSLMQVDAMVLLPGWEYSEGARMEVLIAQNLEIPVYEWSGGYPSRLRATVVSRVHESTDSCSTVTNENSGLGH